MKRTIYLIIVLMPVIMSLFFVRIESPVYASEAGLKLEISGGEEVYDINNPDNGDVYIVKVFYDDKLLIGSELDKVNLKWNPEISVVEIKKNHMGNYFELSLHNKDGIRSDLLKPGSYSIPIHAFYTPVGEEEKTAKTYLTYTIEDKTLLHESTDKNGHNSYAEKTQRSIPLPEGIIFITILGFFSGLLWFVIFSKRESGNLQADDMYCEFYIGKENVAKESFITADIEGNILRIEALGDGISAGFDIEIKFDIFRCFFPFLPKKNLWVKGQSLCGNSKSNIEIINIDGAVYVFDEKNIKFEPEIPDKKYIKLKEGSYIKYFGTTVINGTEEPFMVKLELTVSNDKKILSLNC